MKTFSQFISECYELEERTLIKLKASKKDKIDIPGAEGAARKDVAHAGFRGRGPTQSFKVHKTGDDANVYVRTHKSKRDYAQHWAKAKHQEKEEGVRGKVKELRRQLHDPETPKDAKVHDVSIGAPKKHVKGTAGKVRAFLGAVRDTEKHVRSAGAKKGDIVTNEPTQIGKSKRKRSDEEGAEQRGRIYQRAGMQPLNKKTGVQHAHVKD